MRLSGRSSVIYQNEERYMYVIFTCDNDDAFEVGMTGAQIKAA